MTAILKQHGCKARRTAALIAAVAAAAVAIAGGAAAADSGTIGPVYPIAEIDMLDEIQAVLKAKEGSGELPRLQQAAFNRMRAHIETPTAVAGVSRARKPRSWEVDPSVRFDEPIVDHEGRIVIPAGTLANPLSVVRLSSVLLFIDGRDRAQLAVAKRLMDSSELPVKLILTAGSPVALAKLWQRQVFFDQGGRLVQRFGIQAVPAKVSQAGLVLKVEELPV
ncbi:type-F conjugative transfer system protein TraW [Ideonella sp. YS5]|uniref:type-F conjugative transfer system protein TraW n=1 Tax=Ideonella sp. YS5 TaxID=3453714 RepID=UPI003EEBAE52